MGWQRASGYNSRALVEATLPADAQDAGHRALTRDQNGADQQHLSVSPTPLLEERRKA
jgi:hypothetical protein